jgi:hypothetical protein
MLRGRRIPVGLLATGAVLFGTAAAALATIGGTYTGAGKDGVGITIQATRHRVTSITVSCGRGAITAVARGPFPRIAHHRFSYSGREQSSMGGSTSLRMKVTGTFTRSGRSVSGTQSTSRQCQAGSYSASK